jgi:hypothetical protein
MRTSAAKHNKSTQKRIPLRISFCPLLFTPYLSAVSFFSFARAYASLKASDTVTVRIFRAPLITPDEGEATQLAFISAAGMALVFL